MSRFLEEQGAVLPTHDKKSPNTLLRQYAYEQIRAGVLVGRWKSGEPLSEQQLAKELRISRTPVREAIQALAREGFVEVFPSRGTFVSEPSVDDLREVYELREALEAQCARLSCIRGTQEDIAGLQQIVARAWRQIEDLPDPAAEHAALRRVTSHVDELVRLGTAFHRAIAQIARNCRIQETLDQLSHSITHTRFLDYGTPDRWREMWTQHGAIADAIERRNPVEAEALMHMHFHPGWERYK